MKADDVARYLQDHPQFFDEYAELLAHVYIPHPHSGRTISITERQILTLREKTKQLESKLAELIRFGEENDAIGEKVHRLSAALVSAADFVGALHAAYFHLREDFTVPHVALRLWGIEAREGQAEFEPVSEQSHILAAGLAQPFCGGITGFDVAGWFGEPGAHVRSVALLPLRREAETIGMLALGSEDPERFYPEMGTLYLSRIAEVVSAALVREAI